MFQRHNNKVPLLLYEKQAHRPHAIMFKIIYPIMLVLLLFMHK